MYIERILLSTVVRFKFINIGWIACTGSGCAKCGRHHKGEFVVFFTKHNINQTRVLPRLRRILYF
jgi:hypothetical protein